MKEKENKQNMAPEMEAPGKNNSLELPKQDNQQEEELLLNNDGDQENDGKAEDFVQVADHQEVEKQDGVAEEEEADEEEFFEDEAPKKMTFSTIVGIVMKNWWVFLLNCFIIGSIAALLIVEEPRTYTTEIKLAPEAENSSAGGGLSSLASTFGIDIGNMTSSDAIRPDLYPDLVESSDFIYDLFKLPVKSSDGNIDTDYYTYLKKYQKTSWWKKGLNDFFKKFQDKEEEKMASSTVVNGKQKSRFLTKDEEAMINTIKGLVTCSVDQKTFVITISVTDQDPLIAATVADSVRARIQNIITDYRTKKAIVDFNYYYQLMMQAKHEYDDACRAYAKYVDSHRDVILQSYISERDQLENDMQLKLNTYNTMIAQTQQAKAKIQENTPAFTTIQNAFVPVKPTGPKRMMFVLGMVFLTFIITLFLMMKKILTQNIKA